jgi:hypothetical protein
MSYVLSARPSHGLSHHQLFDLLSYLQEARKVAEGKIRALEVVLAGLEAKIMGLQADLDGADTKLARLQDKLASTEVCLLQICIYIHLCCVTSTHELDCLACCHLVHQAPTTHLLLCYDTSATSNEYVPCSDLPCCTMLLPAAQMAASAAEEQWADTQAQLLACREALAAEVAKGKCLVEENAGLLLSLSASQQELQAEKVSCCCCQHHQNHTCCVVDAACWWTTGHKPFCRTAVRTTRPTKLTQLSCWTNRPLHAHGVLVCLQEARNIAQAEAQEQACELRQAQSEIAILQNKLTAAEVRWLHHVLSW